MHVDKLLHTGRVEGREWGQGVGVLLSAGYCITDLGVGNSYRAHCGLVLDFALFGYGYDPQSCLKQGEMIAEGCVA